MLFAKEWPRLMMLYITLPTPQMLVWEPYLSFASYVSGAGGVLSSSSDSFEAYFGYLLSTSKDSWDYACQLWAKRYGRIHTGAR